MSKENCYQRENDPNHPDHVLLAYFDALAYTRHMLGSQQRDYPQLTPPPFDHRELVQIQQQYPWMLDVSRQLSDCFFDLGLRNRLKHGSCPANRWEAGATLETPVFFDRLKAILAGGITATKNNKLRRDRTGSPLLNKMGGWKSRRRAIVRQIMESNNAFGLEEIKHLVREKEFCDSVSCLGEAFPLTTDDRELMTALFTELHKADPDLVAIIAAGSASSGGRAVRQLLGTDRSATGEYAQAGGSYRDIDYLPVHREKKGRTSRTVVFPAVLRAAGLNGEHLRNERYILDENDVEKSFRLFFFEQVKIAHDHISSENFILYDFFRPIFPESIGEIIHKTLQACLSELTQSNLQSWYLVIRQLIIKRLIYHRLKPKHFNTNNSLGESSREVTELSESSPVIMAQSFLDILRQHQSSFTPPQTKN